MIAADRLVPLPDAIDFSTAAAMMLQGMTAQYLLRRTHPVKAGETVVIHAAAGGVGLIMCQWAKHLGATVIGVVSTEAKAELARAHGAEHVVIGHANLPAEVKRITGGAMVPVVYDSVGRDTFTSSLDCLAPLGLMVSFGSASGPVAPFEISMLAAKGSLFLTRPSLASYTSKRADLTASALDLFDAVTSGAVTIQVHQTFPAEGRRPCARGAGGEADHRQHGADPLIRRGAGLTATPGRPASSRRSPRTGCTATGTAAR